MNTLLELQTKLSEYIEHRQGRLVEILQQLVRMPSQNTPPHGDESACQGWIARQLSAAGLRPDLYDIDEVSGLRQHPLFNPGRNYRARPNVTARRSGSGGGRSLLLSGHIDTVPRGTQAWTRDPFGAEIEGNRLYGRGSNDMKGGVAANLFVTECVAELNLPLAGDLIFESVVDEEFGGANGTLAGRLRGGPTPDAVILSEPSSLRICPAQRGGRTVHITFRCNSGGVLENNAFASGVMPQLTYFLSCLQEFADQRRANVQTHPMYAASNDPVPVSVTKVVTSPWGYQEPITIPDVAQVELYWQMMPGEGQDEVEREFNHWLTSVVARAPHIFPRVPEVTAPMRWLPGSSLASPAPVIEELSACIEQTLGHKAVIQGIEGPCDLFIFQQGFQIPAVVFGARGGNTHAADEYVEMDSLLASAKVLLSFVAQWCGASHASAPANNPS